MNLEENQLAQNVHLPHTDYGFGNTLASLLEVKRKPCRINVKDGDWVSRRRWRLMMKKASQILKRNGRPEVEFYLGGIVYRMHPWTRLHFLPSQKQGVRRLHVSLLTELPSSYFFPNPFFSVREQEEGKGTDKGYLPPKIKTKYTS